MTKEKAYREDPLGSATVGRLQFVRGAANVTIRADPGMGDLYRARFGGPEPDVRAEDGTVTVRYPRTLNPLDWRKRSADVALNGSIPWRIAFGGGGLSGLDADLGGLRLESFEVDGGASRVELMLPEPSGTVPIRVEGGASDLTVQRPKGVAASVRVGDGASRLALDGQRLGAVGGETRLESPDYASATDRYEVVVTGGASNVSVVTK
jgi:hypothetical protein